MATTKQNKKTHYATTRPRLRKAKAAVKTNIVPTYTWGYSSKHAVEPFNAIFAKSNKNVWKSLIGKSNFYFEMSPIR